jgi:hypothetical protein
MAKRTAERLTTGEAAASRAAWPSLPLEPWRATYDTLHMWTQIVGKTRLALAPMQNHWWQVPLYVTTRGLTTSAMPYEKRSIAVEFDFLEHRLRIETDEGARTAIALAPRPVAEFYTDYMAALTELGVKPPIWPVPVEIATAIPFAEDHSHRAYDADSANRFWRVLVQVDRVMKRFRGRFTGKASPVHFFWGSFDLAATRFSGRPAPRHPGGVPNCADYVMVEAYSQECSSCGFWPGNDAMPEAAFYSYVYPEPPGYRDRAVKPAGARFVAELGEFVLPYEAVRSSPSPDDLLLDFFQSTYEAAADSAGWNRQQLERAES